MGSKNTILGGMLFFPQAFQNNCCHIMDLFGLFSFFKNNGISLYKGFDLLYQICLTSRKFKQTKRVYHCVKNVCIRSYTGPHFPAFVLNTQRYSVSLHNQSKCPKMQTRITPNTNTFYTVYKSWK